MDGEKTMYRVLFIREKKEVSVLEGTTILEAEIQANLRPDAPCGGIGTCGKCLVRVQSLTAPTMAHSTVFNAQQVAPTPAPNAGQATATPTPEAQQVAPTTTPLEASNAGQVAPPILACQTKITGDILVDTEPSTDAKAEHVILTDGTSASTTFSPALYEVPVQLAKPLPGEKKSEWKRLIRAVELGLEAVRSDGQNATPPGRFWEQDLELASRLYALRTESEQWYAICDIGEPAENPADGKKEDGHRPARILELRKEKGRIAFAAFDIGTTTVVGYLLDGKTGEQLAVESRLNPQAQHGADVIMRSNYALTHTNGLQELSTCIRAAVSEMLGELAEKAGLAVTDIFQVSLVGNTCMHHLFLEISPESLVRAPYTPALSEALDLRAADYGLFAHHKARLLVLPNIAGYVGADTCGCLLAVRPDLKEEITLLLDIGTNGEMVLGNKERLVACSTAAGPAFEGAKIECGMRGAAGAVDHVFYENGSWRFTTVGNAPAVGICGSGLIDWIACLRRADLLGETGRLKTPGGRILLAAGSETAPAHNDSTAANETAPVYSDATAANETAPAASPLCLTGERAGNARGVYLTQKDIGEVQLAKAAIAAGIQMLLQERGLKEEDIDCVAIAGAFGNYMNPVSAGEIGIYPDCLTNRVKLVGNAAGEGAKRVLFNQEEFATAARLAEITDFIELAASQDFQDYFVDALAFEE